MFSTMRTVSGYLCSLEDRNKYTYKLGTPRTYTYMNVKITFKLSTTQLRSLEEGEQGARTNSGAAKGNLAGCGREPKFISKPRKIVYPLDMRREQGPSPRSPLSLFNLILYYLCTLSAGYVL